MIPEMFVKGKNSIDIKMIYPCEAGAIGKAQFLVFKLFENRFCRYLDFFGNTQYGNAASIDLIHKPDGRDMTASGFQKRIGFVQNIIRTIENSISFLSLSVDGFCRGIVLVFWDGKGTKCTGVYKNLQSATLP